MDYIYFVVEGQHDTAAVGKILKESGFRIVEREEDLDSYWSRMVPRNYPINGNLLKRPPHPTFYQNEKFSIAIHSAGSNNELVKTLKVNLVNLDLSKLRRIGLFIDSDINPPIDCCQKILAEINTQIIEDGIKNSFIGCSPGKVQNNSGFKTGVYVFPDNIHSGTLEDLLLFGAKQNYNDLLEEAQKYVASVKETYKNGWTGSSRNKVLVGCIANVLKPGRANQVSIQDNDWLNKEILKIKPALELNNFIRDFIE
jgi:hypothetical protein